MEDSCGSPTFRGGMMGSVNQSVNYNTYHCVTIAYSIQYSNMLYRFVA